VWKVEKTRGAAALVVTPFAPLASSDRSALADEGEPLLRFLEPDARAYDVRFAAPA
jgi:hypothetical protein